MPWAIPVPSRNTTCSSWTPCRAEVALVTMARTAWWRCFPEVLTAEQFDLTQTHTPAPSDPLTNSFTPPPLSLQWYRSRAAFVATSSSAACPSHVSWAAASPWISAPAAWSGRVAWTKTSTPRRVRMPPRLTTPVSIPIPIPYTPAHHSHSDYQNPRQTVDSERHFACCFPRAIPLQLQIAALRVMQLGFV